MKTLDDLLNVAIEHEISSQKMYQQAYEKVSGNEVKQFIEELIEEEKGHETLLKQVKTMGIYDGSVPLDDESLLATGQKSHDINMDVTPDSSIEDVLEIALRREYKAQTLFNQMARLTKHPELQTLFEKLAEEEENHHKDIIKKFKIQKGEMGFEM